MAGHTLHKVSKYFFVAVIVCTLLVVYRIDLMSVGSRQITYDLSNAILDGRIQRLEVVYCGRFTRMLIARWPVHLFHNSAKPGAVDERTYDGCRRTTVAFDNNRSFTDAQKIIIDKSNSILVSVGESLNTAYVAELKKVLNLQPSATGGFVAAAYFFEKENYRAYALYFSGNSATNGIADMHFINNEWLIDKAFYPMLISGDPGKIIFDNYITGKLDVPVKP